MASSDPTLTPIMLDARRSPPVFTSSLAGGGRSVSGTLARPAATGTALTFWEPPFFHSLFSKSQKTMNFA